MENAKATTPQISEHWPKKIPGRQRNNFFLCQLQISLRLIANFSIKKQTYFCQPFKISFGY